MTTYMPPARPDELYHHGIKGMKWGVRRFQPYPNGSMGKFVGKIKKKHTQKVIAKNTARNLQRKEEAIKKDRQNAYEHRTTLSDDELRQRTQRLNAENNFKNAYENSVRTREKGKGWVRQQLERSGGMLIAAVVGLEVARIKDGRAKAHIEDMTLPVKLLMKGGKRMRYAGY